MRDGSDVAFAAIVERYRGELVRYACRFVDRDRAEDVVQQALINALHVLRGDDRVTLLRPWLYRVCHNLALNECKRRANHHEQLDERFDGVPQPQDLAERRQELGELVRRWSALPARQRQALAAYELEGRNYAEIAATMHTGEGAVRGLLARARSRLRDVRDALLPFPLLRHLEHSSGPTSSGGEVAAGAGGIAVAAKAAVAVLGTAATLGAGVATQAAAGGEPAAGPEGARAAVAGGALVTSGAGLLEAPALARSPLVGSDWAGHRFTWSASASPGSQTPPDARPTEATDQNSATGGQSDTQSSPDVSPVPDAPSSPDASPAPDAPPDPSADGGSPAAAAAAADPTPPENPPVDATAEPSPPDPESATAPSP